MREGDERRRKVERGEREKVCVCVCVCVSEREREERDEREKEREREREREREEIVRNILTRPCEIQFFAALSLGVFRMNCL